MPSRACAHTRARACARLELLENGAGWLTVSEPSNWRALGLWMATFCHRAAFENRAAGAFEERG